VFFVSSCEYSRAPANSGRSAVGPFATIYQIWSSGEVPAAGSDIPLWILGFLGGAIVVGLWTYGYKIMTNLGNRITLISPSRGFSMELGSAITIIVATRFGKPLCSFSEGRVANVLTHSKASPSPPRSASRAAPSVSVCATATGAPSTGAWSHGSTSAGSSRCRSLGLYLDC